MGVCHSPDDGSLVGEVAAASCVADAGCAVGGEDFVEVEAFGLIWEAGGRESYAFWGVGGGAGAKVVWGEGYGEV